MKDLERKFDTAFKSLISEQDETNVNTLTIGEHTYHLPLKLNTLADDERQKLIGFLCENGKYIGIVYSKEESKREHGYPCNNFKEGILIFCNDDIKEAEHKFYSYPLWESKVQTGRIFHCVMKNDWNMNMIPQTEMVGHWDRPGRNPANVNPKKLRRF